MPGGALATLLLAAAAAGGLMGLKKRKRLGKDIFSRNSEGDVRHFFGAILGPVRPSVPCCFGAWRCSCYSSVSSSSSSNGCFGAGRCFWAAAAAAALMGLKKRKRLGKRHFF